MKFVRFRKYIPGAITVLSAAVFVLDWFTPLGIVDWVFYFIPLFLSFYVGKPSLPYRLAGAYSVLSIAGFFWSPPGAETTISAVNLAFGIVTLWGVAALLAQLKRSTAETLKLNQAIEQSPVSVVITDLAGRISYVNPKFTDLTGYSVEEAMGQNPRILKSGEMAPEHYAEMWQTLRAGKAWHGTFHNRKKNGDLFWEVASIGPIFNEAGKKTHYLAVKEDITERKRMEDALSESELHFRSLFENMLEGFAYCRLIYEEGRPVDFIYLDTNKAFEQITGLRNVIGKKLSELVPSLKSARPHLFEVYGRVDATGQPEQFEMQLVTSGKWVTLSAYRPAKGHIAIAFTDITERKLALEAVQKSEKRYRTFVEHNAAGVLCSLLDGTITDCNEAMVRLLGYDSVHDLMSRKTPDLYFNQSDREIILAHFKTHRTLADYELRFKRKDGRLGWGLVNLSLERVEDGKAATLEATIIDISERKHAEQLVTENELRYRQLVECSPDAIFIGCDASVAFVNSAGLRLLGATDPAQILGRPFLDFIHPDFHEVVKNRIVATQQKRQAVPAIKERYRRLDGTSVEVEVVATPFVFEGKDATQVVVRDMTEKLKLESQVLQLQRMENLGMLAGGIAHDLNNVLTPILFSIEVLKDKVTDADGLELLQSLETNVQRGASLVKQVLTFGRGVAGQRIPIPLIRVVREIRHIIQETFPKSIRFDLQAADQPWPVLGDATQLHQVMLNLVVNARDAMPDGGELTIKIENIVLDEHYASANLQAKPGPYVVLTIADTGTGIPKEIRDRIYDPFFTTKEIGKGTGLGLSTTLGIVKSHGGFIDCYSEVGRGTTFKIYLPACSTEGVAEKSVGRVPDLPRGHNELILVVDDEAFIRQTAQKTLEQFGYRVLLAGNGAVALALYALHQQEVAVVITDMAMPVMDGPATIVALTSMNADVKIIGSSGMDANGAVAKSIEAGVKHFIPKPYTAESMLMALREVLG